MTVALDPIVRTGAATVAALAARSVNSGTFRGIALQGAKRPVAVLIRQGSHTVAFTVDGMPISMHDLDHRFPGHRAKFERAAPDRNAGSIRGAG